MYILYDLLMALVTQADEADVTAYPQLRAIRQASRQGVRCSSICSGVFVLAAAGLLAGKCATTHWRHMPDLKQMYPDIAIEGDVLYVDEGNVITLAGSAAVIDACLHLVCRDLDRRIANTVARRLVMPPHHDGGQARDGLTRARLLAIVPTAMAALTPFCRSLGRCALAPSRFKQSSTRTHIAQRRPPWLRTGR